ncbi:unnamed protein product [Arctia plantaginis]|uniref:DUF4773 domain-containing protein n=1 Tax=Arctia plantaginis TaxID=874455 RepID=A0A8S1A5M0_ARCPL|nr:unnamed protein product [Arctia plantaginis]
MVNSVCLDIFNWEDSKKLLEVTQPQAAPEIRNDINCKWKCKGPACVCCIDTNVTTYDPEGAKCIHMRYMSKEEGLFVQISHGKKIEYEKVQMTSPGPICLVMSMLFQMCAIFTRMAPTADGLRGCVHLEPGTIFLSQNKIPLGCFKANEAGMEMSDPPSDLLESEHENTEENNNEDDASETDIDFDPNKFFAGVYQTAQQSIALLSSLLEETSNSTKPASPAETSSLPTPEEKITESTQKRAPKNLKHPNQL